MATLGENVTVPQFLFWKLGKVLDKKADKATVRVHTLFQTIVRLVLHLAGFGGLTTAAFVLHSAAGFAVAGISCFILSRLLAPESQNDNGMPPGYSR